MIALRDLTIRVQRQTLLESADLQIASGDKVVIRGSSGSGKSSLLKTVVGALPLSGGSVHVDQLTLSAESIADIRGRIAYIGQEPVLGAETVREALLLPFHFKAHRHNTPSPGRINESLKRLKLPETILAKPCNRISGGEKQRIAILRAMLLDKTIFLADEVTSALDPESRASVMFELFQPGITLFSVSHDPEWINACDRVVDITDRKLTEQTA